MMKKLILLFALLIGSLHITKAQNGCLTKSPPPPQWIFSQPKYPKKTNKTTEKMVFNIFVHLIKNNNGGGSLNPSVANAITSYLNNSFTSANISFVLKGQGIIKSDYFFYDNFNNKESSLFSVNRNADAIDIYVLDPSTVWKSGGWEYYGSAGIPSTALIIKGGHHNTSTLPHEMGHCLGLYHTHHGTVREKGDPDQCEELVNGSNSKICGDYIQDTPADPRKWSKTKCLYIGTETDANSEYYTPLTDNIMSYAKNTCRVNFTTGQIQRMYDFTRNTLELLKRLKLSLSGSNTICDQETYTVQNAPLESLYLLWQTSSNLQVVNYTDTGVTVKRIGNGVGYIKGHYAGVQVKKDVFLGVPNISFTVLGLGGPYGQLDAVVTGGSPPYSWYKNGNLILTSSQQQVTLPFGCDGGLLEVSYLHSCGVGTYSEPVAACNNYFSMYPNPASGSVTVQLAESNLKTVSKTIQKSPYEVHLYNLQGHKLRSVTGRDNKVQIPLHNLSPGLYIVQVIKNGEVYQKKLLVE